MNNTWWYEYDVCWTQELKRFPSLQAEIAAASNEALENFRDESRKTVSRLVEMESTYLTAEFFRKIHAESDNNPRDIHNNKHSTTSHPNADRYNDHHFRKIGKHPTLSIHVPIWSIYIWLWPVALLFFKWMIVIRIKCVCLYWNGLWYSQEYHPQGCCLLSSPRSKEIFAQSLLCTNR